MYTNLFTRSRLHPAAPCLYRYDGTQLHNLGIATVSCITRSNPSPIKRDFYVTKEGKTIILGLQSSQELGLVNFAKDVKTVDGIVCTQLAPWNNDMQLRQNPDPPKASKATLTTETAICSGKNKLNDEDLGPVRSLGTDS